MFSVWALFFSFLLSFNFYKAPIGLDWKELKDLLNPKFDWEAAEQTAYGTNDSLREVCCLVFCLSYVHELSQQLWPTIF